MEKIFEKLKELGNKIMEWWNRFTAKQKTLIVSVIAVLIIALVIIVTSLTRPEYVLLRECETTKEASEVTDLLEAEGYNYEITDDGLNISILDEQLGQANLLLGANNIQAASYGINNVTDGSFPRRSPTSRRNMYTICRDSWKTTCFPCSRRSRARG